MKIIFFGTSLFAARIYSFLIEENFEIVAVVTRADKPKGRDLKLLPTPVKEHALKITPHVPIYQPLKASTPEFAELLKKHRPDLFVVVAYGEIIKKNILDIPSYGCINIHASLLPKYRGASPIQRCLIQGEKETGVTIMEMVLEMDAGDVLNVVKTPISQEMTFGELDLILSEIAKPALAQVIHKIDKGTIEKIPQNHALCTFAPKLKAQEEEICWEKPAEEIHNLIRALSPVPGAWCKVAIGAEVKRLKIKRSKVIPDFPSSPREQIRFSPKEWIVGCQKQSLQLLEVQLEGKKTMDVPTFLRGLNGSIQFI